MPDLPSLENARALERAWMRNQAHQTASPLDDTAKSIFCYAMRLAALRSIPFSGTTADLTDDLNSFRLKLIDLMDKCSVSGWKFPDDDRLHGIGTLAWEGNWLTASLKKVLPEVSGLLKTTLEQLFEHHPGLDVHTLQSVLAQKKLVLALGGGGGTGFVHLCLFQWLEELGIRPSLITGTSIGALLGYVRAMQEKYDAALTILKLPGLWQLTRSLSPCFGTGKHGLIGMCRIDLSTVFCNVARSFGWTISPSFNELKIPFGCVASGILLKTGIVETLETGSNPILSLLQLTKFSWNRAMLHAAHIASALTSHQAVIPVTFGFDPQTAPMSTVDAISFSMLVPGVLNFELPKHHYKSQEILNNIFKRDHLYRLCDGGLASNVPVRAAVQTMQSKIGHENAYILGIDVFAPQPTDGIFFPLQQIANANAIVDATFADAFVRLKYLLSPMNLTPSLLHLKWLNARFKKSFAPEMQIIEYAMKPLVPLTALNLNIF
ncbi:MAG: patatin-like phospholipase family protein [Proteobacteria bacterium]|nr:patatin-like phospholipase family protein [Pseudomonadota bacterium]